jgi:transposase
MIKNFTNKFGNSKDIIFAIGDYSKGSYNIKGLEPSICKKFRRIFKNAGIETYLINEFRTSKLCNNCHKELEYFMKRDNNKLVNGLLRCQSVQHNCEIIHNRDKNAVQNMLYIINTIKNMGKKPDIFCHTTA